MSSLLFRIKLRKPYVCECVVCGVSVCEHVCVRVSVCVCERERERKREIVCVRVCGVCECVVCVSVWCV
jgi:hypothetical protein